MTKRIPVNVKIVSDSNFSVLIELYQNPAKFSIIYGCFCTTRTDLTLWLTKPKKVNFWPFTEQVYHGEQKEETRRKAGRLKLSCILTRDIKHLIKEVRTGVSGKEKKQSLSLTKHTVNIIVMAILRLNIL